VRQTNLSYTRWWNLPTAWHRQLTNNSFGEPRQWLLHPAFRPGRPINQSATMPKSLPIKTAGDLWFGRVTKLLAPLIPAVGLHRHPARETDPPRL
jgi:hypothetical protein